MPAQEGPIDICILPDFQVKPGAPQDHFPWIAQYIIEKKPNVIDQIGDWNDNHSLNSYETKGGTLLEGARYVDDIAAVTNSFNLLNGPIQAEIERLVRNKTKVWRPRLIYQKGNHEARADRVAQNDAAYHGVLSSDDFKTPGWERHEFLKVVEIEGVQISHYFKMQNSNNPIGGTADNCLNKIGESHVAGHVPGFMYGNRVYPDGKTRHSLRCGSAYLHTEEFRGVQCNTHFRGIVFLHDVRDGNYDIMPVSLKFLCRKYEGVELSHYMKLKYPNGSWDHLA